jgi:hypothetical protein
MYHSFLCLLIILNEVKGFLLLFKIFMRFFVKEIIKDFCWIFAYRIFRGFLASFCHGFLGGFLGIVIQPGFCGFFGHSYTMPFQAHFKPLK